MKRCARIWSARDWQKIMISLTRDSSCPVVRAVGNFRAVNFSPLFER